MQQHALTSEYLTTLNTSRSPAVKPYSEKSRATEPVRVCGSRLVKPTLIKLTKVFEQMLSLGAFL